MPEIKPLPAADRRWILVVDDSTAMRINVKDVLTRYGYGVLEAEDGMKALELLAVPARNLAGKSSRIPVVELPCACGGRRVSRFRFRLGVASAGKRVREMGKACVGLLGPMTMAGPGRSRPRP
jgi:hypothetical protein